MKKLIQAKGVIRELLQKPEIADTPNGQILKSFLEGKTTISEAIQATKMIKEQLTPTPR